MNGKILVVCAHPDDEILGCGGTIARHVRENDIVKVLILGQGMMAREDATDEKLAELHNATKEAAKILGYHELKTFDLPDNQFDTVPLLDIVRLVEYEVADFQPNAIYTHWEHDLNIDHALTLKAVLTACRPGTEYEVEAIMSFSIPSSTGWGTQFIQPNLFVDISETLDKKLAAFEVYESELKKSPHPRSMWGLGTWARFWGSQVCTEAAEPFYLVRMVM